MEAKYYYDKLIDLIKYNHDELYASRLEKLMQEDKHLDTIYKTISKEYLLTDDYLYYLACNWESEVTTYLAHIDYNLNRLISYEEDAINGIYRYMKYLHQVKNSRVIASIELKMNDILLNYESTKVAIFNVDYILRSLEYSYPDFDYYLLMKDVILLIFSICKYKNIDFHTYDNYIYNICCNIKLFIDKLIINGISTSKDVNNPDAYVNNLVRYLKKNLDKEISSNKTIN